MILFALAALAQNPNGQPYGIALSRCTTARLVKYYDDISAPAIIARRAVMSCTLELAAMRSAMQTITGNYMSPNSPAAKQAVEQHMQNIIDRYVEGAAAEIQRQRDIKKR